MCPNNRFSYCRLHGWPILVMALAMGFPGFVSPVLAQVRSPEIIAKERQDPAAGEVVIINRRKKKKQAAGGKIIAPDPYAPKSSPPATAAPAANKTAQPKPSEPKSPAAKRTAPSKTVRKKSPPKKVERRRPRPRKAVRSTTPVAPPDRDLAAPAVAPPLPEQLTRRPPARSTTARLRQFPRLEPGGGDGRYAPDRADPRYAPPRRRDTDDDRYVRRDRRRARRYSGGERPWRQCRIWARRCQAGSDRACEQWDWRCMSR